MTDKTPAMSKTDELREAIALEDMYVSDEHTGDEYTHAWFTFQEKYDQPPDEVILKAARLQLARQEAQQNSSFGKPDSDFRHPSTEGCDRIERIRSAENHSVRADLAGSPALENTPGTAYGVGISPSLEGDEPVRKGGLPEQCRVDAPIDKELALVCLCAWNNVPCDNVFMKEYTDETWGSISFKAWERVANALKDYLASRNLIGGDEGWRPIESAPRDIPILVTDGIYVYQSSWKRNKGPGWHGPIPMGAYPKGCSLKPTHWQPLPSPPASTGERGE